MVKSIVNPALKSLEVFVGEWETELSNASFLPDKSEPQKGVVSFELIENDGFLVQRQGGPSFPWARWIIGRDESEENYSVLYFDDRGVSRKYEMSLADGIWKIWRNAPGFWQRFKGKVSKDGKTIIAHWELSTDGGKTWDHDFDLNYFRLA
jgi:hypothetical protein